MPRIELSREEPNPAGPINLNLHLQLQIAPESLRKYMCIFTRTFK